MFELEAEIGKWKRSLEVAFGGPSSAIDELECHLREDFEALTATGIPPAAAFESARAKLGPPDRLAAEFLGVVPVKVWTPAVFAGIFPLAFFALEMWMAYASGGLGGVTWIWRIRMISFFAAYALAFHSLIVGLMFVVARGFRPFDLRELRFVGRTLAWSNFLTACSLVIGWGLSEIGVRMFGGALPSLVEFSFAFGLTVAWCMGLAMLWRSSSQHKRWSIPLSMFASTFVVCDWYLRILWAMTMAMDGNRSYGFGPPPALIIALTLSVVLPLLGFTLGVLPAGILRRRTA